MGRGESTEEKEGMSLFLCGFTSLVKPSSSHEGQGELPGMAFPTVSTAGGLEGKHVTSLGILHKSNVPGKHNPSEVAEVRNSKAGSSSLGPAGKETAFT